MRRQRSVGVAPRHRDARHDADRRVRCDTADDRRRRGLIELERHGARRVHGSNRAGVRRGQRDGALRAGRRRRVGHPRLAGLPGGERDRWLRHDTAGRRAGTRSRQRVRRGEVSRYCARKTCPTTAARLAAARSSAARRPVAARLRSLVVREMHDTVRDVHAVAQRHVDGVCPRCRYAGQCSGLRASAPAVRRRRRRSPSSRAPFNVPVGDAEHPVRVARDERNRKRGATKSSSPPSAQRTTETLGPRCPPP